MKNRPSKVTEDRRLPLPQGEALLVGTVALLISGAILFFAVSTSRPSEPSLSRTHYEKPTQSAPQMDETRVNPTQLSQKE